MDYTEKEKKSLETLISFGLNESLAKDCIASRNSKELEIIIEFLSRYGGYLNK